MKGLRISEYDVAPGSAPLFLLGELWAALHERRFQLHSLNPGDFQISRAGVAGLAPGAKLNATVELEPEDAAADLARALSRYSAADAAALLAGYTRLGLELLDLRRPGYTLALLEQLQPEMPWPRPLVAPISPAVMRDLGVELLVVGRVPTLVVTRDSNLPRLWQYGLREAFLLILGFLVDVDCRALFDRDRERSRSHPAPLLYQLLWPSAEPIAEAELHRVAQDVPEIELAIGLAQALRGERLAEPFNFNDVLAWVRKVLTVEVHQATLLGDVLSQCARHCASLMRLQGGPASEAESYLQKAIIMLEYSCRGYPSDEERLISMTRSLYELPGYPKPLERGHGSLNLGVWNSLLLTYRALAERSSSHRKESLTGLLRSSMTRGIWAARHQLRRTYATAMSKEPEVALRGHVFLRMTVKSYATLLTGLWESAEDELRVTGTSAWSSLFGTPQNPGPLAIEALWISSFLQAAAQDGFSLDVARAFMNQGAEFIRDDQSSA